MGESSDPRHLIAAAAAAAVAIGVCYTIGRRRAISQQRQDLILSTLDGAPSSSLPAASLQAPLLTKAEQSVASPSGGGNEVSPSDVAANLKAVLARIKAKRGSPVTLIAVSKTKPVELLRGAYDVGQRDFGENYVQEVTAKGPVMPGDVRWHFIGHLQTNKVKELVSTPNLHCVHTVDSLKLASELQKRCAAVRPERPLNVLVQVNTSGEESKSGCAPEACAELCATLRDSCPNLVLSGLMCIGKYSSADGEATADFACLSQCRRDAAARLGVSPDELALSMGMSHDFEAAIDAGATHVRVGSTIFGARAKKP